MIGRSDPLDPAVVGIAAARQSNWGGRGWQGNHRLPVPTIPADGGGIIGPDAVPKPAEEPPATGPWPQPATTLAFEDTAVTPYHCRRLGKDPPAVEHLLAGWLGCFGP